MRIAFITDLHIDAEGVTPRGVDVRQNFRHVLLAVTSIKPALLVVGGDVCNTTGDPAIYRWVKQQLDDLPYPYCLIAGNHDDSVLLAQAFKLTHHLHGRELCYALPLEGRPALFLDSAADHFSPVQWAWLQDYMAALRDTNLLVFMHHPPVPADVSYMDAHNPFRQSDEFLKIVKALPCHVTVVCGHYHTEKIIQRGNLLVLLTPSTFVQLRQDTDTMTIESYQIGFREINLTTHGTNSRVYYLNG